MRKFYTLATFLQSSSKKKTKITFLPFETLRLVLLGFRNDDDREVFNFSSRIGIYIRQVLRARSSMKYDDYINHRKSVYMWTINYIKILGRL